jgi:hypothetical protein
VILALGKVFQMTGFHGPVPRAFPPNGFILSSAVRVATIAGAIVCYRYGGALAAQAFLTLVRVLMLMSSRERAAS